MGNACFVAARDKTVQSGPTSENALRNIRNSPTWSFRWDHRGRVAGEDTSINWFSDGNSRNGGSETKNESGRVLENGSPAQNCQLNTCQKSPISEGTDANVRDSTSDLFISRSVSIDVSMQQANGLGESSLASWPSPTKPPLRSTSLSASPLSSQSHMLPPSSTPSRCTGHSPGHQPLWQTSDIQRQAYKSPGSFSLSEERPVLSWSNESGMHSRGGSSDGWSTVPPGFPELMGTPQRQRWSLDSESFGSNRERLARSSSWLSASPVDLRTCSFCSKVLKEKSLWSTQNIYSNNDLSAVAVLICGHVYHAECLENMTSDINKYDPACPVCSFGEKQTMKLAKKVLKAEMDLKARNKTPKNQVEDGDIEYYIENNDSVVIENKVREPKGKGKGKSKGKGKGPQMDSSSHGKSSFGKPFLRRHFTFGSKGSRSMLDSNPTRKKGFFWTKSSKA